MTERSCVLASYGYALGDPPARQAAASLQRAGWRVSIVQLPPLPGLAAAAPAGVRAIDVAATALPPPVASVARWVAFQRQLARTIAAQRPDLVVSVMLHALAALPRGSFRLAACVYDIPVLRDAGRLDRWIFRLGWHRLRRADVVWSSDRYKAALARSLGRLPRDPIVCHNCPPRDFLPPPGPVRDPWLRAELRRRGLSVRDDDCILLRAGAVGEAGGIEETIEVLPPNVVLVLLGRPSADYAAALGRRIHAAAAHRRVLLWDRPSDDAWKAALAGADIGHLVHLATPGAVARAWDANSALSTNRLFQYLAAGLPFLCHDDSRLDPLLAEVGCARVVRRTRLRDDLRRELVALAENPALRHALGERARAAHVSIYHWEAQFQPVLAWADQGEPSLRSSWL